MNDEIKEILENVKKCCEIMKDNNFVVYQKQDILKLLDYITNLQEENKELNDVNIWWSNRFRLRNEKAIEILELHKKIFDNSTLIPVLLDILQGSDKE